MRALYLEGIRDGRAREAITKYSGERYTQHSTGVRDGVEGFVEFFTPFIGRNPKREIELVRSFQDGRYVFVHAFQSLNDGAASWVTTDLFDTDENGLIVEHWDVISAFTGPNASGHTQIDGSTEIVDLEKTEANKATVSEFLREVLVGGDFSIVTDYISTEEYTQHNPGVADGLDGFGAFAARLHADGGHLAYLEVHHVVGQGNFVASYSRLDFSGTEMAVFDLFRLRDGLIVEHWDNMEPVPATDVNSGKF